ncbi:tetratricopeptide repeat protein [Actinoplanes sp. NPDC051861]|uniref:tetratricopeptide repeat protein n=1 Tax=Actinoplanes sp. NPDC051861 TaxID=3155170 RepID=UPI003445D494
MTRNATSASPVAVLCGWLLVLAGAALLVAMVASGSAAAGSRMLGAAAAVAVMVAAGGALLWRWGRPAGLDAIREYAYGTAGNRWQALATVEVARLGVRTPRKAVAGQLPYATRHRLDRPLREALQGHRFVLVRGPSAAGKSRSVAEHARRLYGEHPVVIPVQRPGALATLLDRDSIPPAAIVWLDDLDRHIAAGVTAPLLRRILQIPRTRVIATIRTAAYDQIAPRGELCLPGRDVLDLPEPGGLVAFTGWDENDRHQAAELYANYRDIAAGLRRGLGLGEYLSGGPELLDRLASDDAPEHGPALVRACADWYRAGMARPMPAGLARELFAVHAPDGLFDEALAWACAPASPAPVAGARLLTRSPDDSTVAVHDYVLDRLTGRLPPGLPQRSWEAIATELRNSPGELNTVARTAYLIHDDRERAESLARAAAARGSADAKHTVAFLLSERAEWREADLWWRAAAEDGHAGAMWNLGWTAAERGDLAEAERWYHGAADRGDTRAMICFGAVLADRGDTGEAERWWRRAERGLRPGGDAGDASAMFELGWIQEVRGDTAGAEQWYRAAAAQGHADAMNGLALVVEKRGDAGEAERWYRAAAGLDHSRAMNNLACFLEEHGDAEEAEHWYRTAAENGSLTAMNNLGDLLAKQGDTRQAERWWRRAGG